MMTQRTLLVFAVCRPVCDDIKNWLKREKDLTPIAVRCKPQIHFSEKIIGDKK